MKNKNIIYSAIFTLLVLLIPLIAMRFTEEVQWAPFDFAVMGILLFITGLIFSFAMNKFPKHRVVAGIIIAIGFLYVWAELAVGIFTNLGS